MISTNNGKEKRRSISILGLAVKFNRLQPILIWGGGKYHLLLNTFSKYLRRLYWVDAK